MSWRRCMQTWDRDWLFCLREPSPAPSKGSAQTEVGSSVCSESITGSSFLGQDAQVQPAAGGTLVAILSCDTRVLHGVPLSTSPLLSLQLSFPLMGGGPHSPRPRKSQVWRLRPMLPPPPPSPPPLAEILTSRAFGWGSSQGLSLGGHSL